MQVVPLVARDAMGVDRSAAGRRAYREAKKKPPLVVHATGDHWTKAQVAARSASTLLASGDTDGAVNRAYYAVFGAARAILAAIAQRHAMSKRHSTIYRRFEKHAVDERGFDRSLGKSFFHRQRRARQAADYETGQVDVNSAHAVIGEMDTFFAAAEPFLEGLKK